MCIRDSGYPTAYPRPGWAEQDPDAILAAACDGIHELLMQVPPVRIACLGLSGTMNGCIPVAADGRALHPNIIHSDSRTGAEVEKIGRVIEPEAVSYTHLDVYKRQRVSCTCCWYSVAASTSS